MGIELKTILFFENISFHQDRPRKFGLKNIRAQFISHLENIFVQDRPQKFRLKYQSARGFTL